VPTEISVGPFRLLPKQFLLLEGNKRVPVGSRAMEILSVLLERPGELVSKQELMDRVWPNVFVEPANLTVHISGLRRMLRDGRDGHRFIINVPGRGYSFVASVKVSGTEPARQPPSMPSLRIVGSEVSQMQWHSTHPSRNSMRTVGIVGYPHDGFQPTTIGGHNEQATGSRRRR
jgi:DNA-binding winged helix-turn-helix (wHTH) protein